jgi:hypothetical protein
MTTKAFERRKPPVFAIRTDQGPHRLTRYWPDLPVENHVRPCTADLLLPRKPFQRLAKEITERSLHKSEIRWQRNAQLILQEAVEALLVDWLANGQCKDPSRESELLDSIGRQYSD